MIKRLEKFYGEGITGQQLYLVSLAIYLCISFLRNTTFNPYIGSRLFNLFSYLVVLLLFFKVLLYDDNNWKRTILSGTLFLIAIVSWRLSTSNLILVMMAFILAARDVSFKNIVKWYFVINLILLISVIIFSSVGIIQNLIFLVKGRADRYALGITYPTDLAAHVLYLVLANVYLNYKKLNWRYYVIYILIAGTLKLITDARLSVLCLIIMVPIVMIAKAADKNKVAQVFVSFYWIITPLLAVVTFLGTYFFDNRNHIFYVVDHMLSGRLSYGRTALYNYPITWFGQRIIEHGFGGKAGLRLSRNDGMGYFYIDSSYMRLIMIYGLLVFIIILAIMMIISIRSTVRKEYSLVAILLVVALSCTVEQHLLELSFNPFLLALFAKQTQIWGKDHWQKRKHTV